MATVRTTPTSKRRIKNTPSGVDINKPLYAHDLRDLEIKNLSVTGDLTLGDVAADTVTILGTIQGATPLVFEGATADAFETSFAITDPTADRTITFQDLAGTVMTYSALGATILPGSTSGTDALTITAGDILLTAGLFDMTLGDMVLADGSITITDADDAPSLSVTNNTATSSDVVLISGSGTFTGDGASGFVAITQSGLTSGEALTVTVDAVTSGVGLSIDSSSAGLTTAGNLLYVGASGDFDDAGGQVVEIESAHTTGTGLQITATAATDGFGQVITATNLTTGAALSIDVGASSTGGAIALSGSSGINHATQMKLVSATPTVGADITNATAPAHWSCFGRHGGSTSTGLVMTEFYIDLVGLSSVADEGDVIGDTGQTTSAKLGDYTTAIMGTIVAIEMVCLEAPTTGTPDIDLYSHATTTLSIDDDATGGTQLIAAGGNWTNGMVKGATALPTAAHALYLVAGAAAAGDYGAGKFLIRIWGS